jgi:response regulator RpfG family c-di-GMP phosphodiesterase
MNVLLIEQNESLLKNFMKHLLKNEAMNLVCTQSSFAGLQNIEAEKYDVVILGPGVSQKDCTYIINNSHEVIKSKNEYTPILCYGENAQVKKTFKKDTLLFFSNYANNQNNLLDSVLLMKHYFGTREQAQYAI